ncbi:ABC transporter permease [Marmoricola sp. URHB0036]|uniref:ABC transporter permease n=1 Tax=Marmoricola sp. URHB0036 TaxID=1298863 RepID=UPI00047F767E|nr:ABC transporter permease [Marmoricola sp. URHB0036]
MRLERPRLHGPTITGRVRSDPGPLLLIGLVVALTTALTSAAVPLMDSTSDRALAEAARQAGPRGAVVATFPRADVDYEQPARDPQAADRLRADATETQRQLPRRLSAVLRPGIASLTTPSLHVLGGGPGRYLTLAYLDSPAGPPDVRYLAGKAPQATVGADPGGPAPWPVQIALSQDAASALRLRPGDRVSTEDVQARPVEARVSGIFVARDPDQAVWRTIPQLLRPVRGVSQGVRLASATALVSAESLPDLRLAVPSDDLTERISFSPRPTRLHWDESADVVRAVGSLQASSGVARGQVAWDSGLDRVLQEGRAEVAAARGQALVLLVGLLACALLVLWQAAELLVRRRAGSVVLSRERGGTLPEISGELFVEVAVFATLGAAVGLVSTRLAVGDAGWARWTLIPLAASLAAAITGAVLARRATDPRRTPANRTARIRLARARRLRQVLLVTAVVAGAVLAFVALRQRGVLGTDAGGDVTAASAPVWWAVAGALLAIRSLPAAARLLLNAARRATGGVAFFVAARVRDASRQVLPLVVITVTVAQLVFAVALAETEQRGQAAGALLSVGGDARAVVAPDPSLADAASRVAAAPGVRAAVAGRVQDDVRATSRERADTVRLVVVDARAYRRMLAVSALPDAPHLGRLVSGDEDRVPALLLGGAPGLRDGLVVRASDDVTVPLLVVGTAPRVQASTDPVVVVDANRYARAKGLASPDTVWAVGPGAAAAVKDVLGRSGTITSYAETLAARRSAPLSAGLVRLAVASAALLLLFAVLAVLMVAASEARPRGESVGRLRALGVRDGQLWRVMAGELATPVVFGALTGLVLGVSSVLAMFGHLSLERITGQTNTPDVALPLWGLCAAAVLAVTVLVLTQVEWVRLRRVALGQLLRR